MASSKIDLKSKKCENTIALSEKYPTSEMEKSNFGSEFTTTEFGSKTRSGGSFKKELDPKTDTKTTSKTNSKTNSVEIEDIKIRPDQEKHFLRVCDILAHNRCYVDTSPMGSGKTIMIMALAKKYNYDLIVIGPKTTASVWYAKAEKYNVNIIQFITYQGLRSVTDQQPKHGLFKRVDTITETGKHKVNFVLTQEALDLFESGVLLVFDEIHNIKNVSHQFKACAALTQGMLSTAGKSRYALLSGTPFDKEENAIQLLRLTGYIKQAQLYRQDKKNGSIELKGAQDLLSVCQYLDPKATQFVLDSMRPSAKNIKRFCFLLYIHVVKPQIMSSMPPVTIDEVKDVKNGFYNMTAEDEKALARAVQNLAEAVGYNEKNEVTENKFTNTNTILMEIEKAKVGIFARLAEEHLQLHKLGKVILELGFTDSIRLTSELLKKYNPLILTGAVTSDIKRRDIIDAFQTSDENRLLICNIRVGSVGISLHDEQGDRPRLMLISPTYSLIDVMQTVDRIYRIGLMSKATIRVVYSKTCARELNIRRALSRKGEVVKKIQSDESKMINPADYESYYEE